MGKKGKIDRDAIFIRMTPHVRGWIVAELDIMDEFRIFLLNANKREQKMMEERIEKDIKSISPERMNEYHDMYEDDYFLTKDIFPKLSLNSFIIIFYSHIESGLNSICKVTYSEKRARDEMDGKAPLNIRYVDMAGKGIERAGVYLKKVFGIDLHKDPLLWSEIRALQKIRNAIVHDEGWANDDIAKDSCVKRCIAKDYVELEKRGDGSLGKIIVKPGYLEWITEKAREFFQSIELKHP